MRVIKHQQLIDDHWQLAGGDLPFPPGDLIVSLAVWQEHHTALRRRAGRLGLRLTGDEDPATLGDLSPFALIELHTDRFADGRIFSQARLLREALAYHGEIRASGELLPDQVHPLLRCGVNSFAFSDNPHADTALTILQPFSVRYQPAVDDGGLRPKSVGKRVPASA